MDMHLGDPKVKMDGWIHFHLVSNCTSVKKKVAGGITSIPACFTTAE